ncbi:MAG: glycosyltransferase family 4 protein [Bacteroidota bacterium]
MKIINIVPGFGGTFYCGNCLRDSGFVQSLKLMGHEAHTLPIYLPLFADHDPNDQDMPVFYGAVNIYVKQALKLKKLPQWLTCLLDSSPVLRYAASKAGSTRATGLGDMTISMLRGHEGYQQEELQQLIDYLRDHEKPDVVHLSNALLLGLAYKIKSELGIPVVCSLQDEDVWVDVMNEPYRSRVWQLMAEKAADVDAFIAVSDYFAGLMREKMQIPDEKLHTVHVGIDPDAYTYHEPAPDAPVIGYLSRLHEEIGLGVLVDAFILLKKNPAFTNARLRLTGGMTADDKRFIRKQIQKLRKHGFHHDVEIVEDFRKSVLEKFFNGLTLLSVPVLKGEAFGLYQLESMASGIPVVQPALGAFPEVVKVSGGGWIYEPNTPEALAEKLAEALSVREKLMTRSRNGRKAVEEKFHFNVLTRNVVAIYKDIIRKKRRSAGIEKPAAEAVNR